VSSRWNWPGPNFLGPGEPEGGQDGGLAGEGAEEFADIGGEGIGSLEGGEVTAAVELRPADDVVVHTPRRWYLLAWDTGRGDWRTFRVDRIQGPLSPAGARFTPRQPPADDMAALDPPELIPVLHALAERLRKAADAS
jgi:hypothetical protein